MRRAGESESAASVSLLGAPPSLSLSWECRSSPLRSSPGRGSLALALCSAAHSREYNNAGGGEGGECRGEPKEGLQRGRLAEPTFSSCVRIPCTCTAAHTLHIHCRHRRGRHLLPARAAGGWAGRPLLQRLRAALRRRVRPRGRRARRRRSTPAGAARHACCRRRGRGERGTAAFGRAATGAALQDGHWCKYCGSGVARWGVVRACDYKTRKALRSKAALNWGERLLYYLSG